MDQYLKEYYGSTGEGELGGESSHDESDQGSQTPEQNLLPDYSEDEDEEEIKITVPQPFPKETERCRPNEYLFIQDDALNFQDKSRHFGPTWQEQVQLMANMTGNFTHTELISDPARAALICKSTPNVVGHLCANIRHKIQNNERISQRERHFLEHNKNWYYSDVVQELSMSLCAELKAIQTDEIQTNGWIEIQKDRMPGDCLECLTGHREYEEEICSRRNTNGPSNCDYPILRGSWSAIMIGVCSLLTLPWKLADSFLNLSLTDMTDYDWDTDSPLGMEIDFRNTRLGRAVTKRLNLIRPDRGMPLYIEFCHSKVNSDKPYLWVLISFFKVIKSLQRVHPAPIVVVFSFATPHKKHTPRSYENLKRDFIRKGSIGRVIAHCMGVPFLELVVQRRPSLFSDTFQWNNSDHWNMEPLFNRYIQPTIELNTRIAANLTKVSLHVSTSDFPREIACFESEEIGEPWLTRL